MKYEGWKGNKIDAYFGDLDQGEWVKIMKQLIKRIQRAFAIQIVSHCRRCPKCKSWFSMEWSSMWHGAWNELCNQGAARSGKRCYECGHFDWDETCEEYKAKLP